MPGCGKRDDFQCDTRVDIRYDNPHNHITTYDTCVYVDKSVDFVDYLWFYTEKTTDGSKMVYNSKRTVVDKKTKRYWISQ